MAEIDTSIYRNIVQPNIDPMGRLYKLQEMQQQHQLHNLAIQKGTLDVQESQREARRSEAISQAMRTSKTHEETVANLRALGVDTTKFEEAYATMNTAQLNQEIKKHELASVKAQDLSNTASQVLSAPETEQDTVYQRVRKPDWPEQRDPAFLHAMQTAKDFNELQKNMAQKAKDDLEMQGKMTANETARLTLANLKDRIAPPRAPVPGTDVPLSPEVEAQKLRLQKQTPGTDVPLSPDVEAQRTRLATARANASSNISAPGDWNKTGEEFLATIPKQWQTTVKKIANYDEDPTKVASMRGGSREQIMQWVNQVNPSYDSTMFGNRAPTRKAFTVGTQGQQINAINTAIGHIDQITGLADKLQNGGFVPGNQAWNTIRTTFGADQVTNFDTLKDALAGEVASVLAKGGATVSGIAEAKDKIKASSSPAQLAGYVKTLIPVMGSKLASLNYQYHQAMGATDPFSALSPESKQILAKHGFDTEHPEISGGGSSITKMKAPDGTVRDVPADQVEHYKSLGAVIVK